MCKNLHNINKIVRKKNNYEHGVRDDVNLNVGKLEEWEIGL